MNAKPLLGASGLTFLLFVAPAIAQIGPAALREKSLPYVLDSSKPQNDFENADFGTTPNDAFTHIVQAPGALWIRLYFSDLQLDGASAVRITSLTDGQVQTLDAASARDWNLSSAYFNGDRVLIELLAAPGISASHLSIDHIGVNEAVEDGGANPEGVSLCGLCGPDDRVPSNDNACARLMPFACSATVFNSCGCLVSAGHCVTAGMVVQFNVPNSLSNCSLVNPPVADQFPIVQYQYKYSGSGGDWAVLKTGTNSLGQNPYQRYSQFKPIATSMPAAGTATSVWGYGVDSNCVDNQRQQFSPGILSSVGSSTISFTSDVVVGNSGSAVIANGKIIGVATNCSCPNNFGTQINVAAFASARATLCPCAGISNCPGDINGDLTVNITDVMAVIDAWGECPWVPEHCPANVDGGLLRRVDAHDLMTVINAWGHCTNEIPGQLP